MATVGAATLQPYKNCIHCNAFLHILKKRHANAMPFCTSSRHIAAATHSNTSFGKIWVYPTNIRKVYQAMAERSGEGGPQGIGRKRGYLGGCRLPQVLMRN